MSRNEGSTSSAAFRVIRVAHSGVESARLLVSNIRALCSRAILRDAHSVRAAKANT